MQVVIESITFCGIFSSPFVLKSQTFFPLKTALLRNLLTAGDVFPAQTGVPRKLELLCRDFCIANP